MTPAPVIIAIDGRSGAGKTTLAIELAATLRNHHKVSLFHLEDIYPGWDGLSAGIERYVTTVLAPLSRGEAATWVSWDWKNHNDGDPRVTLPAEIVIVEGVGAAAAAARPHLDAVIWADAPDGERRTRALARDGETYEPFWDQWAGQEAELLAADDIPQHAHVRVLNRADGTAPADALQALTYLPALTTALVPELSSRRGLRLLSERHRGQPRSRRTLSGAVRRRPPMRSGWTPPCVRPATAGPGRELPRRSAAASVFWRTTAARSASLSCTVPGSPGSPPDAPRPTCPARSSAGWRRCGDGRPCAGRKTTRATSRWAGWATSAMSSSVKPAGRTSPRTRLMRA